MDVEAKAAKNREFAERLSQDDISVLAEIDIAFAPQAKLFLMRKIGRLFKMEDVEEILQETLVALFDTYTLASSVPVRVAYFQNAKCLFSRLIKRRYLEERVRRNARKTDASDQHFANFTPDSVAQFAELNMEEARILLKIEELKAKVLTPTQQCAFERRFSTDKRWANTLEKETGKRASYWRKISDDAKKRIQSELDVLGVMDPAKGGQHGVA